MIQVSDLTLQFDKKPLFEDVNLKFTPGNCYGIIGANGAGKSTFLKVLAGDIEPNYGHVHIEPNSRMAVLRQDHFAYDSYPVMDTVIMGHKRLYDVMKEKEAIYAKSEFTDEDGMRAGDLEAEFAELGGWSAESDAAELLSGLGIPESIHHNYMSELSTNQKVRVLLAQALFDDPDILLLDEPTNDLDLETVQWLEEFLVDFDNLAIVVSHDRHFLDTVCTHVADIDYRQIRLYSGNYSFWYESTRLAMRQRQEQNKKLEEKRKELKTFIERFSANKSKSRQATSRKKMLEKLEPEDIPPSNRRAPGIILQQEREAGDQILEVNHLQHSFEGQPLLGDVSFNVERGDKIAILSEDHNAVSTFFDIINGVIDPQSGNYKWGITVRAAYLPNDNTAYFQEDLNLIDWLRQYSSNREENYIRSFLGKMLFSGEESFKKANVLSGGERMRCMIARMMLQQANVLILDEPTNHLDLEAITAFNNAIKDFTGTVLFHSQDHEFLQSVANRVVELSPAGIIDKRMSFDEYLTDEQIKAQRQALYQPA
jgi:ATPase subunit of ABC transporter with duplicated ATPase domains